MASRSLKGITVEIDGSTTGLQSALKEVNTQIRNTQSQLLCGNVNRLIDTKGMNRISGKPLKTRDSGTLGVAGIPRLILGLCQGNMRTADEQPQWS